MFKKLFFITALVAILATAALPATSALAMTTRIVGFATVNKVSVVTSLPTSFRLRGTYICDKVQINSSVSGKTITIYAYNIKIKGGRVKHILKEAVADLLPAELLARPKEGFIMPVNEWLIGSLKNYVQATLAPEIGRASCRERVCYVV